MNTDEIAVVSFTYKVDIFGEYGFISYESDDYQTKRHMNEMEPDSEWEF